MGDPSKDTTAVIRREVEERVAREREKIASSAEIRVHGATIDALVDGQRLLTGEVRNVLAKHTEVLVRLERGEGRFNMQEAENERTRERIEEVKERVHTLERARHSAAPSSLRSAPRVGDQDEAQVVIRGSRRLLKIIGGLTALLAAVGGLWAALGGASHAAEPKAPPTAQETKR